MFAQSFKFWVYLFIIVIYNNIYFFNELYKCNVVATWPHHVILLVIISNDIPLSPPITLTYYLVPDSWPFWYTKPYSSIIGNYPSYIALLKSAPAVILFVGKRTGCHPICWEAYHPSSYFVETHFSFSSSAPALRLLSSWF